MNSEENIIKKVTQIALIIGAVFFLLLTLFALLLKAFHLTLLGLATSLLLICITFLLNTTNRKKLLTSLLIISLYPFTWLLPIKGKYNPNALLKSEFIEEPSTLWFQGIPESELLSIGEQVGYTKAEKDSLSEVGTLTQQYPRIDESNLFQENYSVLLDSWFVDRKHFWYLEGNSDAPLLIFLHGSGGNFKPYQYWFSPHAKLRDINMAFPTWGAGIWHADKLKQRILELINHLKKTKKFNHSKIFICGLSQGSMTGLKALASGDLNISGFISISGVISMNNDEINNLNKAPVYFIHGKQDERSSFNLCLNLYENTKENPSTKIDKYPGTHTIIKVHTKKIVVDIFDWIENQ